MGKQTEAMKLALEALENSIDLVSNEAREAEKMYANVPMRLARVQGLVALEVAHEKAITALREALAEQPAQQEPVAWMHPDGRIWTFGRGLDKSTFTVPLYTSPPAQQEQKPVAGVVIRDNVPTLLQDRHIKQTDERLYTSPPQRTLANLPDEEIKILWIQHRAALPRYLCFAKALLARSKEKNT